ncbi:hypothetical protein ACE1B6_24240 [Aerosakkonemataceae cyanobacterium BLCC-F154]|uniref:Uncharacterized protein n=1 Tax=Floridaenema fluviatile BLCC-F154 TaxID=3153640 RepID=A0ABV4YJJ8_9CYAN
MLFKANGKDYDTDDISEIIWEGEEDGLEYYESDLYYVEFHDGLVIEVTLSAEDESTNTLLMDWIETM